MVKAITVLASERRPSTGDFVNIENAAVVNIGDGTTLSLVLIPSGTAEAPSARPIGLGPGLESLGYGLLLLAIAIGLIVLVGLLRRMQAGAAARALRSRYGLVGIPLVIAMLLAGSAVVYIAGLGSSNPLSHASQTDSIVAVDEDFYISSTEITYAQYSTVMARAGRSSYPRDDDLPMTGITCRDAELFCRELSNLLGCEVRLPTTTEYLYIAQKGKYRYWVSNERRLSNIAWHYRNSGGQLHPVKALLADRFGIYDFLGNAREYCRLSEDSYTIYGGSMIDDPEAYDGMLNRLVRQNDATICHAEAGFRVVVTKNSLENR